MRYVRLVRPVTLLVCAVWHWGCASAQPHRVQTAQQSSFVQCDAAAEMRAAESTGRAQLAYREQAYQKAFNEALVARAVCKQPANTFYVGASLYHLAVAELGPKKGHKVFADVRCLLEEALDTTAPDRIPDRETREEANQMIEDAILRGAVRLSVRSSDVGVTSIRGGSANSSNVLPLEGNRDTSLCLPPGVYDVEVQAGVAYGKTKLTLLPGERNASREFVLHEASEVPGLVAFGTAFIGFAVTAGALSGVDGQDEQIATCMNAPSRGRACDNLDELKSRSNLFTGVAVAGAVGFVASLAGVVILVGTRPGSKMVLKSPSAPEVQTSGIQCAPGLASLTCATRF